VNIDELLTKLRNANVDLLLDGEELRVSAPRGALSAELRDLLRACFGAWPVLRILAKRCW